MICHYQLAHSIAPNTSPFIRYATYFRINKRKDGVEDLDPMKDIWLDWIGMKEGTCQGGEYRALAVDEDLRIEGGCQKSWTVFGRIGIVRRCIRNKAGSCQFPRFLWKVFLKIPH